MYIFCFDVKLVTSLTKYRDDMLFIIQPEYNSKRSIKLDELIGEHGRNSINNPSYF